MKLNCPSFHVVAFSLLLRALFSESAQAQPAYTELISPNVQAGGGFGLNFGGLPDLTGDGVGEFYVTDYVFGTYVYDGKSLEVLYSVAVNAYSAHSAGDLNEDGIPELMLTRPGQAGGVEIVDGRDGGPLFTLDSPNRVAEGRFGRTLRLLPDMTGDGKEDWLIHQQEKQSESGRVYIFNSQTLEVVRTIQRAAAPHRFWMEYIEVVPDVDGDGKPELLVGTKGASVTRDGQTFSNAGRAHVRSLQTGAVLYELLDPEPQRDGWFGFAALSGIGDVTRDGIADIAVGSFTKDSKTGVIHLFSGKDGQWLRTVRSPNPGPDGQFGRKIESLPDVNGDGVPELWTQEDGALVTHLFDGATSALLQSIQYPNESHGDSFFIGTVRQEAPPGIHAYLLASEFDGNSHEGRVYYMPFTPLPKPPQLKPLGLSKTGFRLQIIGEPGSKLQIQASTDFKSWEAISVLTTEKEPVETEDSTAASHSHRYYRAVKSQ